MNADSRSETDNHNVKRAWAARVPGGAPKAAGVHVKLHIGSEMQHIWFLAFPFLQESHAAIDELKSFLGENYTKFT